MSRSNDNWVTDLSREGSSRESALRDLREVLFRNLRKALADRSVDDSIVEDAVQDSLLRILDRLDQFEGRSRFETWATAIAIRVAFAELRRSRWKDISLNDVTADADFVPRLLIDETSPQAERLDILQSMQQMIQVELSDRQRSALLAELKGMPMDEIARHLGSNRNAIYKLTHDARKKLKLGLEAAGYTAADVVAGIAN